MLPALAVVPLLRYAVAVHSVPGDQPWRTKCPCGKPLWPNAIRPTGRCSGCGQRLGAPPYAVEAAALAATAGSRCPAAPAGRWARTPGRRPG
jgi:leader peptidase (prepilin peptidase)/N-methyltransferase